MPAPTVPDPDPSPTPPRGLRRFLWLDWPLRLAILVLIHGYRLLLSPMLPPSCRFTPSCSAYGVEAVTRHGAFYGGWLTLRRILRCHPWGGHGYDPVPGHSCNSSSDDPKRPPSPPHAPPGGGKRGQE